MLLIYAETPTGNVEEFQAYDHRTFQRWVALIKALGYKILDSHQSV